MRLIIIFYILLFNSYSVIAKDLHVFGLGLYDVKFDGSASDQAADFRYERRLDNALVNIGPEEDNFFYLKPFYGIEATSESAVYILTGVYLEDNLGYLIKGKESDYVLTPSFGVGYYEDGSGKKLGNEIEFRSTLEVSYKINNDDRIGLSFGHISNANLGDKNPGVEIISLSYQIKY
tara:strand:- start:180 stop:710 length:531 start_codon:yes stop_codon:yes gene_type:complete